MNDIAAPDRPSLAPESASPPENALEIAGLTKVYARSGSRGGAGASPQKALDNVTLSVRRGELFGLLGPNGAGKSTLINILGGLVNKTAGHVRIWGLDLDTEARDCRSAIGIVPQELNLDPFFTP